MNSAALGRFGSLLRYWWDFRTSLVSLVPKLYLGTHVSRKLHFEVPEAQLLVHIRSQVQLGNELKVPA